MGGGDLNMKKSWHPQRMDNMEKVWKKEEAARKEHQKMAELKRQIQEERSMEEIQKCGEDSGVLKKKKDRVDWMYSNPQSSVNPDDYLMGKKVDKDIIELQETQAREAVTGGASLTIDMAAKVKEDPLFAIKKQEISSRKALMNNPIRMKQLQQMLKAQVAAKEKSKKGKRTKTDKSRKEKKKMSKKHKKSWQESSEESESNSSEDDRMRDRMKKGKVSHHRMDLNDDLRRKRPEGYGLIGGHKPSSSSASRSYRDSSSDDDDKASHRYHDREMNRYSNDHGNRHSHKRADTDSSRHDTESKRDRDRQTDRHGLDERRHRERRRSRSRSTSPVRKPRSPRRSRSRSPRRRDVDSKKKPKKMDAEELERRRAEMMDNAKWRDEQRKDRVKQYEAEESVEAEMEKKKSKNTKFLDTMRLPSNSSVEDRIKRNIYNIQRTNAALDKNFARK